MILDKTFIEKVMEAAGIQRWNDHIRPAEFTELDKQAHKMIIAYVLGKFEEEEGKNKDFNWIEIIEGGIFEFLQRTVITDLKPQLYHKIRSDSRKYQELNDWIYEQISDCMNFIGDDFKTRFRRYFLDDNLENQNINRRILSAAHFYATKWEFNIIERNNPDGYEITEIKKNIEKAQEKYYDLAGIRKIALFSEIKDFVNMCGQLRFQQRWSHIYRVPKTSVVGHVLLVALFSYIISLQLKACITRKINNFFGGLFHDLPEILTRDIITPVKMSVKGLSELIKNYEKEEMDKRVFSLIPKSWHQEIRLYTENEFKSMVLLNSEYVKVDSEKINEKYNYDQFKPIDGEIIRLCDHLCAYIEAYLALENGIKNREFKRAMHAIEKQYSGEKIAGLKLDKFFAQFN